MGVDVVNEPDARVIGQRIEELRRLRGWSQVQLADKAGVVRATVSRYEHARRGRLELPTLRKIAEAFGVGVDHLTRGSTTHVALEQPIGYSAPVTFVPRVKVVQHDGQGLGLELTGDYVPVTSQLGHGRSLVAIRYEREDVAPEVNAGDDVIVDTLMKSPVIGMFVLVAVGGQLLVRRFGAEDYPQGATVHGVIVGIFRAFGL
jgi:transcriptional regulator with XRE-family HTH domain